MSDTDFNDPFAQPPETSDRPEAEPPQSAQTPGRKSTADMVKRKPKRGLEKWLIVPVLAGVGAWLFWPTHHKPPVIAKVDATTVDIANGNQLLQAAKEADGASEAHARAASAAAQAAGFNSSSHDPNAAAAAAIGPANYAAGQAPYAGNPNAAGGDNASVRAATQQAAVQAEQARREEAEKKAQKAAEIAAAEIQSNGVTTLQQDRQGSTSGGRGKPETPEQMGARLMGELSDRQKQTGSELERIASLAAAAGKNQGGRTDGSATSSGAGQQDQWLSSQKTSGDVLQQHAKPNGFIVSEGTPIRTVLITGLNTDTPGTVSAQVTSDVYDSATGSQLLIPRGSRVIGSYDHNVQNGQDRVLVALTRMIRPDGSWIDLASASGAEMDGEGGLVGDVNNHFLKMFGSALVIGATTLLLDRSQTTVTSTQGLTGTQQGGTIFAQTLNDVVSQLLNRNKDLPPTITRDAGTAFVFLVRRDMSMTPYHRTAGVAK